MATKKVSRAEAKRLAAQQLSPPPTRILGPALQAVLDVYEPAGCDLAAWKAVRAVHHEVMTRSGIVGEASFTKHIGVVASYLLWRHHNHQDTSIAHAFTPAAIDAYYLHGMADMKPATRNDYRSRLHGLAPKVNDTLVAPTKFTPLGYQHIKPGYSTDEEAAMRRITLRQRHVRTRRQLCAVVGLGAGAGLDAIDLRHLRCRHIIITEDLILVEVPGKRARITVVRREYETLVRAAVEGLQPGALVLGRDAGRKSITSKIVDQADTFEDIPRIEISRLRSTWLAALMQRAVPLQVILQAAGLRSARSLADLLPHLPGVPVDRAAALLREDQS